MNRNLVQGNWQQSKGKVTQQWSKLTDDQPDMAGPHSLQPYAETHSASGNGRPSVSAPHTPRQNHLLAALPPNEYERLRFELEPVPLPLGWIVHCADHREQYLYFPTSGIISRFNVTENGASREFAVTGSEGVIGVASFLGGESTPSHAVVLSAGHAYRLRAALLKREFKQGGALLHLLLRYALSLMAQAGQTATCIRHHTVQQQLCLWILSCLDRLSSHELSITQEHISNILGVRREGITEAAGKLQKAGIIQYHRGHITVLDRPRLEAQVCECYAAVKREYEGLLYRGNTHDDAAHCRTGSMDTTIPSRMPAFTPSWLTSPATLLSSTNSRR